jgi:hypothetical protein
MTSHEAPLDVNRGERDAPVPVPVPEPEPDDYPSDDDFANDRQQPISDDEVDLEDSNFSEEWNDPGNAV